jgi:phospholipid-binding lipoprotein MlaA
MKLKSILESLIIAVVLFCALTGCASQSAKTEPVSQPPAPASPSLSTLPEDDTESILTAEEEALFEEDEDYWSDEDDTGEMALIADPIEPFNRVMFTFNDKLYSWVLRPITLGYRKVAPTPIRTGVSNFFVNLASPVRLANCLLQGKGQAAGTEFSRFFVNSTIGLLGFLDVFKETQTPYPDAEDLGQTLGQWGVGSGFYIVWPVLGSSSLRDTVGLAGDTFLHPLTYLDNREAALAIRGYERVNALSFRIEDIDAAKKAAFDPYEAARNFYIQLRQAKIRK